MPFVGEDGSFLKILIVGIVLALTAPMANAFCSEPSAPFCVSQYGPFDDKYDFDSCKQEMESYRNDVEDFRDCLNQKANEATDEYNEAVESFNRRARG